MATKKRASKPDPDEIVILSIKCRREWRDWVAELAKSERASMATLFDQLATERARQRGMRSPPSRGKE